MVCTCMLLTFDVPNFKIVESNSLHTKNLIDRIVDNRLKFVFFFFALVVRCTSPQQLIVPGTSSPDTRSETRTARRRSWRTLRTALTCRSCDRRLSNSQFDRALSRQTVIPLSLSPFLFLEHATTTILARVALSRLWGGVFW